MPVYFVIILQEYTPTFLAVYRILKVIEGVDEDYNKVYEDNVSILQISPHSQLMVFERPVKNDPFAQWIQDNPGKSSVWDM